MLMATVYYSSSRFYEIIKRVFRAGNLYFVLTIYEHFHDPQ